MPTIEEAICALDRRRNGYIRFRDYYSGRHRFPISTEKFRNAFGRLFNRFSVNLCPAVVNAVADRLQVTAFQPEGLNVTGPRSEKEAPETLAAREVWQQNRMDRNAGHVHLEALREGDSYVIVWPGKTGFPRIWPQRADEVTVHYDPDEPDTIEWAAKGWLVPDAIDREKFRFRLNLYYDDRIEKYVTRNTLTQGQIPYSQGYSTSGPSMVNIPKGPDAYMPYTDDGDNGTLANTFGRVPVFHFANDSCTGDHGSSELQDVIPLQDALNKAYMDMLVALEFVALPQRWMTGVEPEIDEATGAAKQPFQPGVDRVWTFPSTEAKLGEFPAANLTWHLAAQDGIRMDIARISGTPLHYMMLQGGVPPSGEALKTQEGRLIKKVLDRQISYGNTWEDVVAFAMLIQGKGEMRFNADWEDPAPRSELEHMQALQIKSALGVSRRQLMTEMDYSLEQIDAMEAEKQAEDQAAMERQIAVVQARPGLGGPPGGGGPPNARS